MKELLLGEAIKQRRLELGLNQEQVCEGICEIATLSRLESGKQMPAYHRIRALLQRLGMPDDRYYALLSPRELQLKNVRKELLSCCTRFARAGADQKRQAWDLAMEQVRKLEELTEEDDAITRQFILSNRATLGRADGPYSSEECLSILLEALRLTVPKFDPENIGSRRYSLDETRLINQIALAYSNAGDHIRALDLYGQLFDYVHKHDDRLSNYAAHLTLIAHNYAQELALLKYCHRAIDVAEEGKRISVNYGYYLFLPGFLAILGECYYLLGEKETSKKLCVQAHYLYEILDDERNLRLIDPDIRARFDLEFPV